MSTHFIRNGLLAAVLLASAGGGGAWEPGSGSDGSGSSGGGSTDSIDRADRAAQKAAEDIAKVQDRAARDATRYTEERAKIMADSEKDPAKAAEDLAKLDADAAKWEADRAEETAKIESDLAEEEADIREDSAQQVEQSSDDQSGGSRAMDHVGLSENPDRDRSGFPVRRGEIVALDLGDAAVRSAMTRGFAVIENIPLEQLGRSIVRLSIPHGMDGKAAIALVSALDPKATVDFTHYYGMQPAGERAEPGDSRARLDRKRGSLRIGMVDTRVADHPFLRQTRVDQRSFGAGAAAPPDHGTAVASILASEGTGRLSVADIFRGGAGDLPFTSADAVARGLEWMSAERMPVINMSLAGPRNAILDTLILRAIGKGTVVVASAGNGGPTAPPAYPAALPQVIAVTAVDERGHVYRYANQGRYITVAARGVHEPAASAHGGYGYYSGTSFATPHIAAWMARCLEKTKQQAVDAKHCTEQLIASARDLGDPGQDPVYGHGVVR